MGSGCTGGGLWEKCMQILFTQFGVKSLIKFMCEENPKERSWLGRHFEISYLLRDIKEFACGFAFDMQTQAWVPAAKLRVDVVASGSDCGDWSNGSGRSSFGTVQAAHRLDEWLARQPHAHKLVVSPHAPFTSCPRVSHASRSSLPKHTSALSPHAHLIGQARIPC